MNIWWVNHKQTARQEIGGGYIWSPKRRSDGGRNQFYEFMRETRPGDVVVSFANARIGHFGIVSGLPISAPKPDEFGAAGENWSNDGWYVPISWTPLAEPFRPKDHISQLVGLLPERYSPIRATGDGNQGAYLAKIDDRLLLELMKLGSFDPSSSIDTTEPADGLEVVRQIEDGLETNIQDDQQLSDTEKDALVKSRRGQGIFRRNVEKLEPRCRVTGLEDPRLLIASHIKPWRACETAAERLDGSNGLLLAPHIDRLFDIGLITFERDGALRASNSLSVDSIARLGLEKAREEGVGSFTDAQEAYLSYHRDVFLA